MDRVVKYSSIPTKACTPAYLKSCELVHHQEPNSSNELYLFWTGQRANIYCGPLHELSLIDSHFASSRHISMKWNHNIGYVMDDMLHKNTDTQPIKEKQRDNTLVPHYSLQ